VAAENTAAGLVAAGAVAAENTVAGLVAERPLAAENSADESVTAWVVVVAVLQALVERVLQVQAGVMPLTIRLTLASTQE
jgi:hypothetical protein